MPAVPVQLAGITVEERSRCRVRPAEGEAAATLWEEVAKALSITQLTLVRKIYRFRTETFRRTLDPALNPLDEKRASDVGFGDWSFVSLPPESLAQRGFVYDSTGGPVYVAPDSPVLLSEAFLSSHCFRLQSAADDTTPLIGLAFEPAHGRRLQDIAGVLWLDRGTAELKFLEYHYTNLAAWIPAEHIGGRVEFDRLPTGAWFIRGWLLTPPIPRIGSPRGSSRSTRPGGPIESPRPPAGAPPSRPLRTASCMPRGTACHRWWWIATGRTSWPSSCRQGSSSCATTWWRGSEPRSRPKASCSATTSRSDATKDCRSKSCLCSARCRRRWPPRSTASATSPPRGPARRRERSSTSGKTGRWSRRTPARAGLSTCSPTTARSRCTWRAAPPP